MRNDYDYARDLRREREHLACKVGEAISAALCGLPTGHPVQIDRLIVNVNYACGGGATVNVSAE
jgi:hypothetical protein